MIKWACEYIGDDGEDKALILEANTRADAQLQADELGVELLGPITHEQTNNVFDH